MSKQDKARRREAKYVIKSARRYAAMHGVTSQLADTSGNLQPLAQRASG